MKLYENGVFAKEQSMIYTAIDINEGKEYIIKKDCNLGGVIITQTKDEDEWEINEKILALKSPINEKYISFVINNKQKTLIFDKGICDLSDFLQNVSTLTDRVAEFLIFSMIKSVQLIHGIKIAHNDIKSKNFVFFINENNEVFLKLIDFGSSTTKMDNFESNTHVDCLRLIKLLNIISIRAIGKNQDRITQWIQYFQSQSHVLSIEEIYKSFLKQFSISEPKLINSDIIKSLREIEKNIHINKNVSFEEFIERLDKLCLVDSHPLETLFRAEIMEKIFLEQELYTKYVKLTENKIVILNYLYFKDFTQCKLQSFDQNFIKKIIGIEDSIEKLSKEMKKLSKVAIETYKKNLHRNGKVYDRLNSLGDIIKLLIKFYDDKIENIRLQNEDQIKKIEQFINENEKKIKIKTERKRKSVIHYEIFCDFLRFLKFLSTHQNGKSIEERYKENFEISLKKYLIFDHINC